MLALPEPGDGPEARNGGGASRRGATGSADAPARTGGCPSGASAAGLRWAGRGLSACRDDGTGGGEGTGEPESQGGRLPSGGPLRARPTQRERPGRSHAGQSAPGALRGLGSCPTSTLGSTGTGRGPPWSLPHRAVARGLPVLLLVFLRDHCAGWEREFVAVERGWRGGSGVESRWAPDEGEVERRRHGAGRRARDAPSRPATRGRPRT